MENNGHCPISSQCSLKTRDTEVEYWPSGQLNFEHFKFKTSNFNCKPPKNINNYCSRTATKTLYLFETPSVICN